MSADVTPYTDLITSQHANKPKFVATVTTLVQPFADGIALQASLPTLYDVDVAAGVQLDAVGLWVGVSRALAIPIDIGYFSFDISGRGFDEGVWFSDQNPQFNLVVLPDDQYRLLIRATILEDHWTGSKPELYVIWNTMFAGMGLTLQVIDLQNMTMTYEVYLNGVVLDTLTQALIQQGYLTPQPDGVQVNINIHSGGPNSEIPQRARQAIINQTILNAWAAPPVGPYHHRQPYGARQYKR